MFTISPSTVASGASSYWPQDPEDSIERTLTEEFLYTDDKGRFTLAPKKESGSTPRVKLSFKARGWENGAKLDSYVGIEVTSQGTDKLLGTTALPPPKRYANTFAVLPPDRSEELFTDEVYTLENELKANMKAVGKAVFAEMEQEQIKRQGE